MSALAALLLAKGWTVSGSDRSRDRGETPGKFERLAALGIALHPQDLGHPATARSIAPTLDRWLARHRPLTYGALAG